MKIKLYDDWEERAETLRINLGTRTKYYGMTKEYLTAMHEQGAIEVTAEDLAKGLLSDEVVSYLTEEKVGKWLKGFHIPEAWCEVVNV